MPSDRVSAFTLALILSVVLVACGGGGNENRQREATPSAEAPVALPADPQELPDYTPERFDALLEEVSAGTPVVVNFWGSWCGPCRREAPILAAKAKEYEGAVQFIGVNIMDTKEGARRFMDEYGMTFPSVFDPSANGDIRSSFGFVGQPATLFFNYGGEESYRWEGEISEEQLERAIRPLLPSA